MNRTAIDLKRLTNLNRRCLENRLRIQTLTNTLGDFAEQIRPLKLFFERTASMLALNFITDPLRHQFE